VGNDGKVWTAGDAKSYGDVQDQVNDIPTNYLFPTGIAATPSGNGYYIVMDDGGVFSFGDAVFYGSTGGNKPGGHSVTGIALSIGNDGKVNGYWLVSADGSVHPFGQAPYWGNAGVNDWRATSIVSFPTPVLGQPAQPTRGYGWVLESGEIGVVYGTSGK
jgi:hypothetical protein